MIRNRHFQSRLLIGFFSLLLVVSLTACGAGESQSTGGDQEKAADKSSNSSDSKQPTLTLYNGQHKDATLALIKAFEEKTGIKVEARKGSSNELAHQIAEEGDKSPADLIYTEETTPLIMLADKGLLEKVDAKAREHIQEQYTDPDDQWVGITARSRVVCYHPELIKESDLPKTVRDFAKDEWKDKVAYVPTSGAFQKQVSAMIKLHGEDKAKAWLEGLKANGKVYKNNKMALEAVERGEIEVALINNYYWDLEAKEKGADKMKSKLYFFGNKDIGDMITVSGAAVLKSSKNKEAAQQFLEFATSEEGQKILTDVSAEYPLNAKVTTEGIKPFSELSPPEETLDLGDLSDGQKALELLQEVGLL
ncbi:iron ABC transporter substrate-binding protein [Numidum massiliense]|uniref:iron ABC transporter substrate-binding protein n=1 Tax=Numidum massiliense TaxID=1522315 RepID=UPI0006D53F1B|nr:iron ABC transporter substrate-binding protein [Numidum massiliense]